MSNRAPATRRSLLAREEPQTNHDLESPESGVHLQAVRAPDSAPQSQPLATELERFMDHMLKIDASDLYLTVGSPPVFRTAGVGMKAKKIVTSEQIDAMFEEALTEAQKVQFDLAYELNFALARGEGRYRVNVFRQRGQRGMVIRLVRTRIRTLDEMGYPNVLKDIAMSRRGLVLVVGGTGSGKSTALAGMIDHRNTNGTGHILTIEDPIEFIHPHKGCIVTQREMGEDTLSIEAALKNALRQAPDVVLIGEIRDKRTMEAALELAETGHLCISTLHSNSADQAVERVLNMFPSDRHSEIRSHLALNLRAVVSQRLVPSLDGKRAAALEILTDTPRVKQLIRSGEFFALKDAMEQSAGEGCRTFDSSLFELFAAGRVSADAALKASDSPNNLRLRIDRWNERDGKSVPQGGEVRLRLIADASLPPGR